MEAAKEKKRKKLNALDWIIIVVLLAGIVFAVFRFAKDDVIEILTESDRTDIVMVFSHDDIRADVVSMLKEGDEVYDNGEKTILGKLVSVELSDSQVYTTTDTGEIRLVAKPGSYTVRLVVEGSATEDKKGRFTIKGSSIYLNRSLDLSVGSTRIYPRLVSIGKKAG